MPPRSDAVRTLQQHEFARERRCLQRRLGLVARGEQPHAAVGALHCAPCGGELGPHQPQPLHAARQRLPDGRTVLRLAPRPQFEHVAQHGDLAPGRLLGEEIGQRRLHARRIGIVTIHDQRVAGRAEPLRAVVIGHISGHGIADALLVDPEIAAHGHRRRHVEAVERPFEPMFGTVGDRRIVELHSQIAPFGGHLHQHLVVAAHERAAAAGSQIVVQLALAAPHAVDTSEAFEMRPPDVGEQTEIGFGDRAERCDLAAGARPHLHHPQLRVARHRQQRQRHADVVVEIAPRGVDRISLGQHAAHQLFGRGLAVAAGDRQQRNAQPPPVLARQRLQRRQRVAHDDDPSGSVRTRLRSHRGIIHDGARRTGRERRGGETVAVEAFAAQREEDRPLPRPPRIVTAG